MAQTNTPRFQAPEGGRLTPEMIAAYRQHGFLVLDGFAGEADCIRLRGQALELMNNFDPAEVASVFSTTSREHQADRYFMESGDKIRFFFEQEAFDAQGRLTAPPEMCLNKIGHALHDLDPVFERFSMRPEIGQIAHDLGSRDPSIVQSMYILKPPRIGGEVSCHQDSTYVYTEPDSCIGFWFAVEDATTRNGCMYFIPGQHGGTLRERNHRTGPFTTTTTVLDATPFPMEEAVPVEAPVGSLVIFHGRAPHYSGPNRSEHSRHAYTLHVIDRACDYPADNWLQRGPDMPLRPLGP